MSSPLEERIAQRIDAPVDPAIAEFAKELGEDAGAIAVLFYGSNLRTGEREGVLDFYVLLPGEQRERIWPRISYHEREFEGTMLRAKVATLALVTFARAAAGESRDTTIWARFVQPSGLVWRADAAARDAVAAALAQAARTAARLAAALGPDCGSAEDYWRALFQATYRAEFRVEKLGREDSILSVNRDHFEGLLPLSWSADGVDYVRTGTQLFPALDARRKQRVLVWWRRRRRLGKPLNLVRLAKASTTFQGAARYAAWKIERHTGVALEVTPWRERHPLLAAPGALWKIWRARAQK